MHRLERVRLHEYVVRLPVLWEFAGARSHRIMRTSLLVHHCHIRADHLLLLFGVSGGRAVIRGAHGGVGNFLLACLPKVRSSLIR